MPVPTNTPLGGDVVNKNFMELGNNLFIPPISADDFRLCL